VRHTCERCAASLPPKKTLPVDIGIGDGNQLVLLPARVKLGQSGSNRLPDGLQSLTMQPGFLPGPTPADSPERYNHFVARSRSVLHAMLLACAAPTVTSTFAGELLG